MYYYDKNALSDTQIKAIKAGYFNNLPFKESTVRQFLQTLVDQKWFYRFPHDLNRDPIWEIIDPPELKRGLRILKVSEGEGVHTYKDFDGITEYPMGEDDVYITLNDHATLAGGEYTFHLKRVDDNKLKLISQDTHWVS